jgi:hypothetical protein
MKKILVLLLLMVVSTSVFAEWTVVGGVDGMTAYAYADSDSIKKKGTKVKMWSLFDYKTVQKFDNLSYLSSVTRNEYDCEEETRRMLDLHWYSGNMRQGDIVYSNTNIKRESKSIIPESTIEVLFKIACDKK